MSKESSSKLRTNKTKQVKEANLKKLTKDNLSFIPEKYHDLSAILFLLLVTLFFFAPIVFQGKAFIVPDNTASLSTQTFINDAKAEGIQPQWIPYVFSGMPSLGSLFVQAERWYDISYTILWKGIIKSLTFFSANPEGTSIVFFYFIFGVGVYLLLRVKGCTSFQSLIGATGATLATVSFVWITVGHNTKIVAASLYPYLLIFAERLRRSEDWKSGVLNIALLSVVLSLLFGSTHVQMIYYGAIFAGVYFLVELIYTVVMKEAFSGWLRSAIGFGFASLLAAMMFADTYLAVLEYSPFSIRGASSVTSLYPELNANPDALTQEAATKGGLSYEYATGWSFGVEEVMTFFAPGFFGYGNSSYWGPQPFTMCPQFFGVTILIFAIIGLIAYRRDRFVQSVFAVGLFALLVSFGKHFSIVFDALFYFAPFFNKFRAPSMILVLTALSACLLAGFGVRAIYEMRENSILSTKSLLQRISFIGAAICIIGIGGFSGCKPNYIQSISESARGKQLIAQYQNPAIIQSYESQFKIFEIAKSDMTISLFITATTLLLVNFFVKGALSKNIFQSALMLLLLFDFWRVDAQLLQNVQPKQAEKKVFEKPDYVSFLEKDNSKFRLLPLLRENDANWYAYFRLESVGGYQGAKMRIYQDLIELFGNGNTETPTFFTNSVLLDLLNLKYIVIEKPTDIDGFETVFEGTKVVKQRVNSTPRAWFVNEVQKASVPEIIRHIQSQDFSPREMAYVEDDLQLKEQNDTLAKVEINSSGIHHLGIKTSSNKQQFLFVSELYYDKGWKCFIDDLETKVFKSNYAFRGVLVPKGNHEVRFIYESTAFNIGKLIAIISNGIVFFALVFSGVMWWQLKRTGELKME